MVEKKSSISSLLHASSQSDLLFLKWTRQRNSSDQCLGWRFDIWDQCQRGRNWHLLHESSFSTNLWWTCCSVGKWRHSWYWTTDSYCNSQTPQLWLALLDLGSRHIQSARTATMWHLEMLWKASFHWLCWLRGRRCPLTLTYPLLSSIGHS